MDYTIQWRGTNGNNFTQGRAGQKVIAIVDHIMQGTMESTDSWFKAAGSGASTQYGVAKDGRLYQWVAQDNMAWANGVVKAGPETPTWVKDTLPGGKNAGVNVNNLTISIEHEGGWQDDIPEPQYQATLYLHLYLVGKYKIPLDKQHILGHYQIDAVNRPYCPGPNFPFNRLLADLAATISPPNDPNVWHCIETDKWVTNDQGFLDYWRNNGGLPEFGFPVSGAAPMPDNPRVIAQWFERARLEYHPDKKIYRGRVGAELLALLESPTV